MQPEAFFLPAGEGQRFCLFHGADTAHTLGLILYIHPFAEEMNKARRMAALQSRALARAGYAVLQIDLLGCGDSSGDFGDATWQAWVGDVVQGCAWLRQRWDRDDQGQTQGPVALWLWGLRAGCLLAVDAAPHLKETCHFLFWQPPASGKVLWHQFMRLKAAGNLLAGQGKGAVEQVRQAVNSGETVEIAGYLLSAGLARGLEQSELVPPAGLRAVQRLVWLELSTQQDAALGPVSAHLLDQWQRSGAQVSRRMVGGPAFWQTTEIEDAQELIAATLLALSPVNT